MIVNRSICECCERLDKVVYTGLCEYATDKWICRQWSGVYVGWYSVEMKAGDKLPRNCIMEVEQLVSQNEAIS